MKTMQRLHLQALRGCRIEAVLPVGLQTIQGRQLAVGSHRSRNLQMNCKHSFLKRRWF